MKKKIKRGHMLRLLFLTLMIAGFAADSQPVLGMTKKEIVIAVEGEKLTIPQSMGTLFVDKYGIIHIPLRVVAENLGCGVKWDNEFQAVTISRDQESVMILDTRWVKIKGRIYVPLSFVSKEIGYTVTYKDTQGKRVINIHSVDEKEEADDSDSEEMNILTYSTPNGAFEKDIRTVGSLQNPACGVRLSDAAYEQDIVSLNKLLEGTKWEIGTGKECGRIQLKEKDDSQNLEEAPVVILAGGVGFRVWPGMDQDFVNERVRVAYNMTLEACKYFCGNENDAMKIVKFIDENVRNYRNINCFLPYQFGNTTVRFEYPREGGMNIFFEDKNEGISLNE